MNRSLRATGLWVLASSLLMWACASHNGAEPADNPAAESPLVQTSTSLALVDTGADVDAPMDAHPLGTSLLVAERAGTVKELTADGSGGYEVVGTVADLRDEVGSTDSEKGLLGITTDPAGEHMYLNHTRAEDGATVVLEIPLEGEPGSLAGGDPRELLVIDQPFPNHNGGDLAWGPDDKLWIGTGDGGSGGDPGGRAQRLDTLLGKILRLDPALDGSGSDLVPDDNPYADGTDESGDEAEPLIWARGVRNPWRIAFDAGTGDLWVADVGQSRVEEVSVLLAADGTGRGADLGWDRFEGDEEFEDSGPERSWPNDDAPIVDPVHTYDHNGRCSISGGFLYRAATLGELGGAYLFSDYCDGELWALLPDGGAARLGVSGDRVVSINADENGEPIVLDGDGISRLSAA